MEESGEQYTVVFALTVTDPPTECVCGVGWLLYPGKQFAEVTIVTSANRVRNVEREEKKTAHEPFIGIDSIPTPPIS